MNNKAIMIVEISNHSWVNAIIQKPFSKKLITGRKLNLSTTCCACCRLKNKRMIQIKVNMYMIPQMEKA